MAKALMKALRMQITVFNPYQGEQDVSIGNILDVMGSNGFSDDRSLHKKFPNLEYKRNAHPPMADLKIFPILDIDAYDREKKAYVTGNMFSNSSFSSRITPIFNDPNLDEVMASLKYDINTSCGRKATSYHEIFDCMDSEGFFNLSDRMKEIPEMTNLPLFFETCMSCRPEFQGRL